MAGEILSTLVTLKYSTDLTDPITGYKTIVCEDTSEGGGDTNITETKTKCGTFSAVDTPTFTVTGSGVLRANPASDEASFAELLTLLKNRTLLSFLYQNEEDVDGGVAEGAAVFMEGQGRFTSVRATSTEGDLVKFNWAISLSGYVETNPNS